MVQAWAVIGANYGDEGKGLLTDYYADQFNKKCIVVRHNGGAQAGHTVTTPEGFRHVFKHFGSGTFAEAPTYLSRFFVCNPILFFQELELLQKLGVEPLVYADPNACITTPYDMMINQIVEEDRGDARHGSCGVGFGETVERQEHKNFSLTLEELQDKSALTKTLKDIQNQWVFYRLEKLGIKKLSQDWLERIKSEDIFNWYVETLSNFEHRVTLKPQSFLKNFDNIIFEGAQGLLLDQDEGAFPHVTRSNTGIKNVVTILKEIALESLNVTYVTRAYCTRHGAGPLENELSEKPTEKVIDITNVPNEYQGSLRFSWLNISQLANSVQKDFEYAAGLKANFDMAVTCLDQVNETLSYWVQGELKTQNKSNFLEEIASNIRPTKLLLSSGSSRNFVSNLGC